METKVINFDLLISLQIKESSDQPTKNYIYRSPNGNLKVKNKTPGNEFKRLKLNELTSKIDIFVKSLNLKSFEDLTPAKEALEGLKTLKKRVQKNLSDKHFIVRIFLTIFGYIGKYEEQINKIEEAKLTLKHKIRILENQFKKNFNSLPKTKPTDSKTFKMINPDFHKLFGFHDELDEYIKYQRKIIYGFGVGQNKPLSETKELPFKLNELKNHLEGENSDKNLIYLSLAMEKISNNTKNTALKNLFNVKISNQIAQLILISKGLVTLHFNGDKNVSKNNFQLVSGFILESIIDLGDGERIIIPSGTTTHATLLILKKLNKDEVEATFFNTGKGVTHHFTDGSFFNIWNQIKWQFPLSITFEPKKISEININSMTEILNAFASNKISIKDLCNSLHLCFGKATQGPLRKAQINGVCSFQVFIEAFREIIGNDRDYKTFKRELLLEIKKEFENTMDYLYFNPKNKDSDNQEYLKLRKLDEYLLESLEEEIAAL